MDRLWAPWRSKYIYSGKKKRCIFCNPRDYVVARTKNSIAMLNIYPYNNGHVMVSPVRHVKSIEYLSEAEIRDLMAMVIKVKKILDKELRPDGYNIGFNIGKASGAGFDKHIHIHIVPRWIGDANFMPVTAGVKVLSDSLESTYRIFRKK